MTAMLNLIYCFLMDMIQSFRDIWIVGWDSVLSPVDTVVSSVGTGGLTVPTIANEYAWLLGATGMSQAIAIIAGAMGVRFILQTIPFVRWGGLARWENGRKSIPVISQGAFKCPADSGHQRWRCFTPVSIVGSVIGNIDGDG